MISVQGKFTATDTFNSLHHLRVQEEDTMADTQPHCCANRKVDGVIVGWAVGQTGRTTLRVWIVLQPDRQPFESKVEHGEGQGVTSTLF